MTNIILSRNLGWIQNGYSFWDIMDILSKRKKDCGFICINSEDIQNSVGTPFLMKEVLNLDDYSQITYLVINDCDFDGDISFLKFCVNIKHLFINNTCNKTISNINSLENLSKLKYINLRNNSISDIEVLKGLTDLEELNISENPVRSIKPITHFKHLKTLKAFIDDELEVFQLLNNSKSCKIDYCIEQKHECYLAGWINNWAFKWSCYQVKKEIIVYLEPLQEEMFKKENKLSHEEMTNFISIESTRIANEFLNTKQKLTIVELNINEYYCAEVVFKIQ